VPSSRCDLLFLSSFPFPCTQDPIIQTLSIAKEPWPKCYMLLQAPYAERVRTGVLCWVGQFKGRSMLPNHWLVQFYDESKENPGTYVKSVSSCVNVCCPYIPFVCSLATVSRQCWPRAASSVSPACLPTATKTHRCWPIWPRWSPSQPRGPW